MSKENANVEEQEGAIHEHILNVDLSPITGNRKSSFVALFQPDRPVHEFLDDMWLVISEHVPPYTFGSVWALRDRESGMEFVDMGRRRARRHLKKEDVRTLEEVGFMPGMKLEAILLDETQVGDAGALAA